MRHAGVACDCLLILLAWDELRQDLVRRLQALGLPLIVLVVALPEEAEQLRRPAASIAGQPIHVLETGKIAEGLQRLGRNLA
jgi:hypothetical protein